MNAIMFNFIHNNKELATHVADSNEVKMIPLLKEVSYKGKIYKIDVINFNLDQKAYEIHLCLNED